jgi:hypothetical protein
MGRVRYILPLLALLGACGSIPQSHVAQPVRQSTAVFSPMPEARACLADLGRADAAFSPLPDRYLGEGCAALNTVLLAGLRSDDAALAVSNLGPVSCPLAQSFAAWARFGVDRAARQVLGSPLARIETMGSFACRNVGNSGRRSAHATANAIDVAGFVLADGRRISVQRQWSGGSAEERRFLELVHASACKRFGTVLGPGYNAAHHDHFHVETGGQSFCR